MDIEPKTMVDIFDQSLRRHGQRVMADKALYVVGQKRFVATMRKAGADTVWSTSAP